MTDDVPPKDRDIAMVFQNYALYPHMTVADNMAFALKVARVGKAERAAAGAGGGAPARPRGLPRPQAQGALRRPAAAGRDGPGDRAPARRCSCMDEPLSNLDAKLRVSTRTQIAALQQRLGVTTVYVTHDQVEAMTMGDRVAVMKDGVLQQVDTPLALYDRPANLFVAGFIGSPAMNLLAAKTPGDGAAVVDGYRVPARPRPPRPRPTGDGHPRRTPRRLAGRRAGRGRLPGHGRRRRGARRRRLPLRRPRRPGAGRGASARPSYASRAGRSWGRASRCAWSSTRAHVHVFDTATGARLSS